MPPSQSISKLTLLLAVLLLVVGACGSEGVDNGDTAVSATDATANALSTRIMAGAVSDTSNASSADFQQQFEVANALWKSHNIDNYTVTIRYSQPGWNVQIIDITVKDGLVIDHTQDCYPPRNCILQKIDPAEFTIDKLLIVAEYVGNLNIPDHPAQITFSQTYGYPSSIGYEDGFWGLTQFQPTNP
ncbi:MAG TPA: DUF6174 domain-containing protein [Chloroflexota bacterium]|nr:DUF6174 domain-containing protein [Chloroflexota bacterium]HUM70312.1 DUF6174 domain-containing protein [Chloroflexota bacterium]